MTSTNITYQHSDAEIRIYVACLAAYNHGVLHGRWIDALEAPDVILEEVKAMLKASPIQNAEEWAIRDYEGFEGIELSEWGGFAHIHDLAHFIQKHGKLGAKLLGHFDNDVVLAGAALEEDYCGEFRSLAEYAEEFTTETSTVPENLAVYIDYDTMARDLEMSSDIFTIETGFEEVHVFWAH